MKIILGTAHLSSTAGKRSPNGKFREYKYSREICKLIKQRLTELGINCIIDYEDDDMPNCTSSQELINRVKIVNDICKKEGTSNILYISVHVNASASNTWSNATGFSIYTSPGVTKSDKLATCIFKEAEAILKPLSKRLRTDNSDGDPDFEENFYVLRKTLCPAVLTENFFQDNKSDIEFLLSDVGKKAIVDYHVNGILKYLGR